MTLILGSLLAGLLIRLSMSPATLRDRRVQCELELEAGTVLVSDLLSSPWLDMYRLSSLYLGFARESFRQRRCFLSIRPSRHSTW